MYYPCSENKGADQLRGYVKMICAFVFAQAFCWFSYAVAHMIIAKCLPVLKKTYMLLWTCELKLAIKVVFDCNKLMAYIQPYLSIESRMRRKGFRANYLLTAIVRLSIKKELK